MKKQRILYSEFAYVLGIVLLAFGTALMEKANFGMSMVVAPAYLLHLKLSETLHWFSFGVAEYCLQAVLLLITMAALRKFKPMYLFSFATAVIYGTVLDLMMRCTASIPSEGIVIRSVLFIAGLVFGSVGVAFFFRTYIAPEAYELLVKEISTNFNISISRTKTVYDCTSCIVSIIMSFAFFGFGHFEGVKLGTVFCALVNGWLIGKCSAAIGNLFEMRDGLKLRRFFE